MLEYYRWKWVLTRYFKWTTKEVIVHKPHLTAQMNLGTVFLEISYTQSPPKNNYGIFKIGATNKINKIVCECVCTYYIMLCYWILWHWEQCLKIHIEMSTHIITTKQVILQKPHLTTCEFGENCFLVHQFRPVTSKQLLQHK